MTDTQIPTSSKSLSRRPSDTVSEEINETFYTDGEMEDSNPTKQPLPRKRKPTHTNPAKPTREELKLKQKRYSQEPSTWNEDGDTAKMHKQEEDFYAARKPSPPTTMQQPVANATPPTIAQVSTTTGNRPSAGTASHRGEGTQAHSPPRSIHKVQGAVSPSINDSPDGKKTKHEMGNSADVRAQLEAQLKAKDDLVRVQAYKLEMLERDLQSSRASSSHTTPAPSTKLIKEYPQYGKTDSRPPSTATIELAKLRAQISADDALRHQREEQEAAARDREKSFEQAAMAEKRPANGKTQMKEEKKRTITSTARCKAAGPRTVHGSQQRRGKRKDGSSTKAKARKS